MNQRPNVKARTVKLLEENTGENFHKLELTKDFQARGKKREEERKGKGKKHRSKKGNIDKLDSFKI